MTSNINPNNINGAYPVAGQDNNSQGFRDNFTNTKTNFAYAAAEITDLENKAILKAALTGTTLNNNMNGSILSNFQGQNISGTVVSLGTINGDVTIDYSAGPYQTVTTGGTISLAFTNFTPAGTEDCVLVEITVTNTAYTVQLPSAVGYGASATSLLGIEGLTVGSPSTIAFSSTGTYIFQFITTDNGTTIFINDISRPRNNFSGPLTITDTTASNSTSTGALVVSGGVGIAGNLYVGGNIVGNVVIDNIESIVGNVTAGNVLTGGLISATANVTGGNLRTGGLVSATGNITVGNVLTGGLISATGNITGGNINGTFYGNANATIVSASGNVTGSSVISNGILSRFLDVENIAYANITATGTYSLNASSSINVLIANNTGYTATLNMPSSPLNGQICNFSISGNTVTLAVGTGTVLPTFAGSTTAGTGYRYVYRTSNTSWYRIG